jgi:PIN domain
MSHSLGRDSATDLLLSTLSPPLRLAIPVVCFMEAFSAFEDERRRHNRFVNDLEQKVSQLKRNDVSLRVRPLIDQIGKTIEELDAVFNEARVRLYGAIETLRTSAELIGLTPEILDASLNRPLIKDPTDDLILASILDHASSQPSERKAFLSENRKDFDDKPYPKSALESAGVKYFAQASKFLEWHRSQSES